MGAFIHPLMSLFFIQELESPPAFFGFYTIAITLSGLVISQYLAAKADQGYSTLSMYLFSVLGIGSGLMLYGVLTHTQQHSFILFVIIAMVFIAMGNAAIPQMLTLARQWSTESGDVNITQFNTRLRAAISIAWVIGPALGFIVAAHFSFTVAFYLAAGCGLIAAVFAYCFAPRVTYIRQQQHGEKKQPVPFSFWLLVSAIVLGSGANVLYSSALPLYTIDELNISPALPGLFIASAALLEIPIILFSGRLARFFNKTKLMMVAFIFAMIFYTGIYFAQFAWQFFALQAINAIFYGLFAGLSLTTLQEQLPKRVGFTSTLCSNALKVGMMLGSTAMGVIAQFSSFRHANIGAFIAVLLGFLCLLSFHLLSKDGIKGSAEN